VTILKDRKLSYFLWKEGDGMVTAQDIFITAMNLMDEDSEDGTFDGYPLEYKKKAWKVLTLLQAELSPASTTPTVITDENSYCSVDDRTSLTVLPYGLAAQLLLNEDQNRAAFFNARYDELKRKRPAKITPIVDVYANAPEEDTTEPQPTEPDTDGGDFDFETPGIWDGGEF
jgi:hypothetical protein